MLSVWGLLFWQKEHRSEFTERPLAGRRAPKINYIDKESTSRVLVEALASQEVDRERTC